jgi:hypothetical protein
VLGQIRSKAAVSDGRLAPRRGRLDHHALGAPGRAGGVEHDRTYRRRWQPCGCHPPSAAARSGSASIAARPALPGRRRNRVEPLGRIVEQTARLVIDDFLQDSAGILSLEGLELVDLLLVLHDGEAHGGMVDEHRPSPPRPHRHRQVPAPRPEIEPRQRSNRAGPVRPHHRDFVAAGKTDRFEADGKCPHLVELLCPGPALPYAVILVAHGGAIAETVRIEQQILRKRIKRGRSFRQNPIPPVGSVQPPLMPDRHLPPVGNPLLRRKFSRIAPSGNNALDRQTGTLSF